MLRPFIMTAREPPRSVVALTIERGRVVEDGSHDQLIRSNGRYAKLHYLQAGIHDIR